MSEIITNENGTYEVIDGILYLKEPSQKWIDEKQAAESVPKPIPIEDLLAEKDRQIIELKKMQNVTDTTVSEISSTLQELIEITLEMGNV